MGVMTVAWIINHRKNGFFIFRPGEGYEYVMTLTAVGIASVDELSGGRAVLGIGAGGSGFREMGIERARPVTAMREAIELIRRLLAGEEVDYPGELIRFRRGALRGTAASSGRRVRPANRARRAVPGAGAGSGSARRRRAG